MPRSERIFKKRTNVGVTKSIVDETVCNETIASTGVRKSQFMLSKNAHARVLRLSALVVRC